VDISAKHCCGKKTVTEEFIPKEAPLSQLFPGSGFFIEGMDFNVLHSGDAKEKKTGRRKAGNRKKKNGLKWKKRKKLRGLLFVCSGRAPARRAPYIEGCGNNPDAQRISGRVEAITREFTNIEL